MRHDFWSEELTPEQTEALLDKATLEFSKRGLQAPAILFFEMHKPLANVLGHASLAFSPFLVPILGYGAVNDYSRLLSKRENVEALIQRLEGSVRPKDETKEMTA